MLDIETSDLLRWGDKPLSILSNDQKIQLKQHGERLSFSLGDKLWPISQSEHQYCIVSGRATLRNASNRRKLLTLRSGDLFGSLVDLSGLEITASDDEVIVVRWPREVWDDLLSPDLQLFWALLDAKYQPNPSRIPYEENYPFTASLTKETGAACLIIVSEYLQNPVNLKWAEYQLKGQKPSNLVKAGERLGLELTLEKGLTRIAPEQRWEQLKQLAFPLLLRGDENHWVVAFGFKKSRLIIADPYNQHQKCEQLSQAELSEMWDGLFLRVDLSKAQEKFNLNWFIPAIKRQSKDLTNIIIASFVLQILGLATPLFTRVIFDQSIGQQNGSLLNVMAFGLLGVAIFEMALNISRSLIFNFTTRRLDLGFSAQIFSHLLRLPLNYFEGNRKVGDIVIRVQELEKVRQFFTSTLTTCIDGIFAFIYLALMFYISARLASISIFILALFITVIGIWTPWLRKALDKTYNKRSESQSFLVEAISGIQSVKAHTAERDVRDQWESLFAQYVEKSFDATVISETSNQIVTFLSSLSSLLILWAGAGLIINRPDLNFSIGSLIAFQILSAKAIAPLLKLTRLWQNFQQILLSIEHLRDILDRAPETSPQMGIVIPSLRGQVKFNKVSFRYENVQNFILEGASFEVNAGEFVGVVGPSGSGKSTLSKLLLGLYQPNGGSILLDNEFDVKVADLESLREQIGVVLQEDFLFDAPVWKNIVLGDPEATVEDAMDAAVKANADEFIRKLPQGYNTSVGERGNKLSGGQRQRLALSRLFLSKAPILILDEATSALDPQTERTVVNNLQRYCGGKTIFMITHRLKSIESADVILAMGGGLIEFDTHEILMNKKGIYWALHQSQYSDT
ncbi:MAG: peptidase domain-containing ABC transporter [Leptolyngbyaceae cyanobacterium]